MKITKIIEILEVETLLKSSSLPSSDLRSNTAIQLYGTFQKEKLIACVGVEIYAETALLRSLAVDSNNKQRGIGRSLLEYVENVCKHNGVQEIFLLTETAEKYFEKFGYTVHDRQNAPRSIKNTTQFSTLCPSSSIFMAKILYS